MQEELKRLWSTDGLYVDKNDDGVIDGVSLFVQLDEGPFPLGLLDFFAAVGQGTTALSYQFFEEAGQRVTLCFEQADEAKIFFEQQRVLLKYKERSDIDSLLYELMEGRQHRPTHSPIPIVESLSDLWTPSGFGVVEEASPTRHLSLGMDCQANELSHELGKALCHFIARAALSCTSFDFPVAQAQNATVQMTFETGDVDEVSLQATNQLCVKGNHAKIMHELSTAECVQLGGQFGLWERACESVREAPLLQSYEWHGESEVVRVEEILATLPPTLQQVEVFISRPFAFRQELKKRWQHRFHSAEILVRAAFKPGFHWLEEEVVPLLRQAEFDTLEIACQTEQNQGLELPIRWIQEMYPIDLLLARELNIAKEAVEFSLQPQQQETYVVYGRHGQQRTKIASLDVPVCALPYVDGVQSAYPTTTAIRYVDHQGHLEEVQLPTDRAAFYQFYQTRVLPQLRAHVQNYAPGQGHTRPFFDRIEVNAWFHEEERKLHLDEERISPLEAIHEDLYFNTLDYFAHWGEEVEGKPFHAIGGVEPFMHVTTDESPHATIAVYEWHDEPPVKSRTLRLSFEEPYEALVERGNKTYILPMQQQSKHPVVPHTTLDHYLQQTEHRVIVTHTSYRGLAIPTIECMSATGEAYDCPLKMTARKKTILIEAGHHANEVSSTPAVIELMKGLTPAILREVNVVVIPLANPDGYQLLLRLMDEHPEWKHHAARYNAVGLEYAYVRFQPSVFGEADVLPELMRRWAPDIVLDKHGIPSHEWTQPFAGYNSPPRFPVSYFLPSAKMYGIGKRVIEQPNAHEASNFDTVFTALSRAYANTAIDRENTYWRERYQKYGNDWLPETFLIERASSINFYEMAVSSNTQTYQAIARYPDWVAADLITEAADEIVYENVLASCVNAQLTFSETIIELLSKSDPGAYDSEYERERPIVLMMTEEE